MAWVTIVIVLALLEFAVFGGLVARARGIYGIRAPAVSGHPIFERYMRVHQNTMEQLVVFIPAIWLFSSYWSPQVGAMLGLVFIASRALYAAAYVKDPGTRTAGSASTALVLLVLLAGAVIGAARTFIH